MIGTPTVCVNGNNLPICNGSLDESVVSAICMQFTGLTSMLIIIGINNFIKNGNASNMTLKPMLLCNFTILIGSDYRPMKGCLT